MFRWQSICKFYRYLWILIFYYVVYTLFIVAITPDAPVTFVSNELRVGGKYVLMFLVAPQRAVFSDLEGADVFMSKGWRCGRCFITNNKGFLPITEYDAVLTFGKRVLLNESAAAMDPGKRYLIETTNKCITSKFKKCLKEPRITSFDTRESYTLCSLCKYLSQKKHVAR